MFGESVWLWLYLPVCLFSLCFSLHYNAFTKNNLLAWAIMVLIFPRMFDFSAFPSIGTAGRHLIISIFITVLMLGYFYGVKKGTPLSEAVSFTIFTASSFAIVKVFIILILLSFGVLY